MNMRSAVIGAKGFIGANLARELRRQGGDVVEVLRETSLAEVSNTSFDYVFFCAGNSKGFISERQPLQCLQENVGNLHAALTTLNYRRFIHVSSVSVYPQNGSPRNEATPIDIADLTLYGAHKYLAEQYVRKFAPNGLIVRPTGFFGPGLKKNLIFDVKNGKRDVYLSPDSFIDFMPVEWFCRTMATMAVQGVSGVVNVGSGVPLPLREIVALKPSPYIFHNEKHQDDRGVSLERLWSLNADRFDPAGLLNEIRGFIATPDRL